jgi:hypothetical protein
VEYNDINYILITLSVVVIATGITGFVWLIIRDCKKRAPVKEYTVCQPYHKPPPKRQLSFVYEKYFIDFKIQTLDKLKLPPITDSVYTTRDEFDKHKVPNRM